MPPFSLPSEMPSYPRRLPGWKEKAADANLPPTEEAAPRRSWMRIDLTCAHQHHLLPSMSIDGRTGACPTRLFQKNLWMTFVVLIWRCGTEEFDTKLEN